MVPDQSEIQCETRFQTKRKPKNIPKFFPVVHFFQVETKHGRGQNNKCLMFFYGRAVAFVVSKTGLPICGPQVQGLHARLAGLRLQVLFTTLPTPTPPQPPAQPTKTPHNRLKLSGRALA